MKSQTTCGLVVASMITAMLVSSSGCSRSTAAPRLDLDRDNGAYLVIRDAFVYGSSGAAAANPLDDPNRAPQWASITGVIRVNGSPPAPGQISVDKDQQVCGRTIEGESIVVGSGGELQNVLIFLDTKLPALDADEEQPVWVHDSYSYAKHPELQEATFDQEKCVFLSHVFGMRSDQTLKILNSDPVAHNTKIDGKNAQSINAQISANSSTTYVPKFQEESPVRVSCSIHPWMSAWLISRNNPYFSVSQNNGEFTIDNIPAGVELEYRIWHEQAQFLNLDSVTLVDSDGEKNIDVKKGRFKLDLKEREEPYVMRFEIDASNFQ